MEKWKINSHKIYLSVIVVMLTYIISTNDNIKFFNDGIALGVKINYGVENVQNFDTPKDKF